jgi:hypothetical protein
MTSGASAQKTRRILSEHYLEKLRYIGVEMFVKRCAVEARQAIADFLHLSVSRVGDDVMFGRPHRSARTASSE